MSALVAPLLPAEVSRLAQLEAVIERGATVFVEVGTALWEIRESRLYRGDFTTFEDYCRERWHFGASHARQLIDAVEVVKNLESVTTVTLPNERQARELVGLPPDQQREVWTEALSSGKPTAEHIKAVRERLTPKAERVIETLAKDIRTERREANRQERLERITEIAKGNAPLPTGKYPIIYADPPWAYKQNTCGGRGGSVEHYPVMQVEEICELGVSELATPDAVLYLWATGPLLPEALRVVEAWGFTYLNALIWVKDRPGVGFWLRGQAEFVLICKRGAFPAPAKYDVPPSVLYAPRGEHSAKPSEVAELIEKLYPQVPKIELFCRSPREGWSAWGNQA